MPELQLKWDLEYWTNINGKSPVLVAMEGIRLKDKVLFGEILKKVSALQTKNVVDLQKIKIFETVKSRTRLYEFKIHVRKEFRILGVLNLDKMPVPIFYALHAFIKKDQKIKQKEIETAIIRLEEFKK